MDGQTIKTEAEQYLKETMTSEQAISGINLALGIIGDKGLVYDEIPATDYEKNVWITLPDTYTAIVEIHDSNNIIISRYQLAGNKIRFFDSGNYTIHYRRLPNNITVLSGLAGTIEVHPGYKAALVQFLISWYRLSDEEGDSEDGLRLRNEFTQLVDQVYNTIVKRQGPHQMAVIRHA